MKKFHEKKLSEINVWAWAATILPMVALAALFFMEFIGLRSYYHTTLVIGATIMFGISVCWWWWALYTIANVTKIIGKTTDNIEEVTKEVITIKDEIKDLKK